VAIKHVKWIFVCYFVTYMKKSFVDANKLHANKSFVPERIIREF